MPNNREGLEIAARIVRAVRRPNMECCSMNRVRTSWTLVSVVGIVLVWNTPVRSQTPPPSPPGPGAGLGQHASDNVSGGAIAARAPGNMVNAGVVRAQTAAGFASNGIKIVETTRPTPPHAVFLSNAIKIIFDQLNSALQLLENVLRLRAGLPPLAPQATPPPTTTGGTTTGSTTGG